MVGMGRMMLSGGFDLRSHFVSTQKGFLNSFVLFNILVHSLFTLTGLGIEVPICCCISAKLTGVSVEHSLVYQKLLPLHYPDCLLCTWGMFWHFAPVKLMGGTWTHTHKTDFTKS
jgi:hypothetical protein